VKAYPDKVVVVFYGADEKEIRREEFARPSRRSSEGRIHRVTCGKRFALTAAARATPS